MLTIQFVNNPAGLLLRVSDAEKAYSDSGFSGALTLYGQNQELQTLGASQMRFNLVSMT
jgi:hypothetical protein